MIPMLAWYTFIKLIFLFLESRKWQPITEEGFRRTEHTTVAEGDHMYVFGGYSGTGYENSVLAFNFTNNTWAQMEAKGDMPAPRSARILFIAVVMPRTSMNSG